MILLSLPHSTNPIGMYHHELSSLPSLFFLLPLSITPLLTNTLYTTPAYILLSLPSSLPCFIWSPHSYIPSSISPYSSFHEFLHNDGNCICRLVSTGVIDILVIIDLVDITLVSPKKCGEHINGWKRLQFNKSCQKGVYNFIFGP